MNDVRALVFDTFGTVVDWRGSIARRIDRAARAKGVEVDADAFARAWRAGYRPGLERVISGERPFTPIDVIHRERLDEILDQFGIGAQFGESERAEMVLWWHRLDPWPDSVPGLRRLSTRFLIGPLSNGSTVLLASMAKRAAIPWDFIMSSDIVRAYKRDPAAYLNCCRGLGLETRQVMMCAAHNDDLDAAQSHGMRTAYINRPYEYGQDQVTDFEAIGTFDIVTDEIGGIADALGC
ncbi:MAG TPA: haloacid dehalogenase type II [Paracoccaceae bacterium]|nr:haloacid dehalogenase type II [Paracoccaceae bacterium]